MRSRRFLYSSAALACTAGTLAVSLVLDPLDPFGTCGRDNRIGYALLGTGFELVDETGQIVSDEDVITEPTLFYIGYTFCPDVCPLDNMRNALVADILKERGLETLPVFVSVDPKRDTPEVLAAFTDNFHPEMLGLTGDTGDVTDLADAFASTFVSHDDGTDEFYLIDHTTYTFLILPDWGVVDVVMRDELPDVVADRVECLIQKAQRKDPPETYASR